MDYTFLYKITKKWTNNDIMHQRKIVTLIADRALATAECRSLQLKLIYAR